MTNIDNLYGLGPLQMILETTNDETYKELQLILSKYASKDEVLDEIKRMDKRQYLKKHPYEIYYSDSEHRYRTYVPVYNGTKKRKPMVAKTKEELENKIVDYYKQLEKDNESPDTMEKLYPLFLTMKGKETTLENARKLKWVWDKYYCDSAIIKRRIKDLSIAEMKEWNLDIIQKYQLTRRQYREVKSLANMIFDYAIDRGIIDTNKSRNVSQISYKKFAKERIKSREEQVYIGEEQQAIMELAIEEFKKTQVPPQNSRKPKIPNMAYLGVCLNFCLGLRVGELVGLKVEDFSEEYVHIERQEVGIVTKDHKRDGYEVVAYTKTPQSIRDVVLTPNAKMFYKKIVSINKSNGFESEYLMLNKDGGRMHKDAIQYVERRLNKILKTPQKSNHSIRKTCLSNMHNSGELSDEQIRAFAGHKHISTTQNCYFHDTTTHEDSKENYQKAIDGKMSNVLESIQSI